MFKQPAFIRKNTPELRKKLEELGYKLRGTEYYKEFYLFTDPKNGLYRIDFYSCIPHSEKTDAIDCGTNEWLFLAIAALRDDNDYLQWFTNSKHWYLCRAQHFKYPYLYYEHYISAFRDGDGYYKATVEELVEYFKEE